MAFVFYLKDFNSDIVVMIQSLGGNTLPQAFDIAVQAKNNLIDIGKLSPHPIMLVFSEISTQVMEEAAPSTSAPQSMYSFPTPQTASSATEAQPVLRPAPAPPSPAATARPPARRRPAQPATRNPPAASSPRTAASSPAPSQRAAHAPPPPAPAPGRPEDQGLIFF
ncbi:predicted GPI-anchored protein 58 [Cryptomeria japonica]|uniref:predicted GPI-anchored protein 58 n=1 Tax=Cryptomeria japonica TaxID=3369 RepID=UPI0027DA28CD|nr:predicted GPI-anchored protein 58 [Cryptomeria japonica]